MKVAKLAAGLCALIVVMLSGCASVEPDDGITELTLNFSVSDRVNPDGAGRPSPIFLQIHELRDSATFRNSRYLDVYRDARGALGSAYVATFEVGPLYPGTDMQEVIRLNTTSGAVGILGEFNRYQETERTMLLLEFSPGEDSTANVVIDAAGLRKQ